MIQPIRSTTQNWVVTYHPGVAALVFQTSLARKVALPNVGCFLRLLDNNIIMFAMLFKKRQHELALIQNLIGYSPLEGGLEISTVSDAECGAKAKVKAATLAGLSI